MSGPTCNTTAGMPRGPFPPSTANYTQPNHCVFPANANTTSIFTSCIISLNSKAPIPVLEPFTDVDHPGCEYLYANFTSTTGIVRCWAANNTGVNSGCYGTGSSSPTLPSAASGLGVSEVAVWMAGVGALIMFVSGGVL